MNQVFCPLIFNNDPIYPGQDPGYKRTVALGDNSKVTSMVQEVIWRMVNTSEKEPQEMKDKILDSCVQMISNS